MTSFYNIRVRAASIVLVQVTGLASTMAFVLYLSDVDLAIVVGAMALSGLISGTAVSNNTAKLYAMISVKHGTRYLTGMTLCLFAFEQVIAQIIVLILVLGAREWTGDISITEIALLAMASSSGSLIAFVKFDNRAFSLFNLVRFVSVLSRLVAIFIVAKSSWNIFIPAIIIASQAIPLFYALNLALSARRGAINDPDDPTLQLLPLLREYLYGIPAALCRSFINQGLIVAAVQMLTTDELRMFRFLLVPKDAISRIFNAVLPLTYDRMYSYKPDFLKGLQIAGTAVALASGWYFIGDALFEFGWSAASSFIVFLVLNLSVYSVLPVMWRRIYRNKAAHTTIVVLVSCSITTMVFWLTMPETVQGILTIMSTFSFIYILGMLVLARYEQRES